MMEIRPTAVPVRTSGICPRSITAKYKERAAYTPVATIKTDMKNRAVADFEIKLVANRSAPINDTTNPIINQKVLSVLQAHYFIRQIQCVTVQLITGR